MKFIDKNTIKLDKVLNKLDEFVIDFIKILEKHTRYVIISGYVAILFGRSRGTEDVDVFIKELTEGNFFILYKDLLKNGYWCLNTDDEKEAYEYLERGSALRFALKDRTIPNFEIKFAKKPLQKEIFEDTIKVVTKKAELIISSLERQIAFKKYYLKSNKDLEDARHIEELFKEHIDLNKIKYYKKLIEDE
ncbi:MAG: hypothetical protein KKG75_03685 [Nanoarchaeota archaeon]|nr:hypothetical protein [Nanoarchaeota archaeon]